MFGFSTDSVDSLTRTRFSVAAIAAAAAICVGLYTYNYDQPHFVDSLPPGGLQRRNAVRHGRRDRRSQPLSSSSSDNDGAHGDENEENIEIPPPPPVPADAETVVDDGDDWWNEPGFPAPQRTGHNIVNLLFRVSEDNARRNGCVHRGCQCNACGMVPIRGVRYRCANCADFDLCEACESQGVHIKTHIFYKIRVPAPPFGPRQMQPVWYTGDPDTCLRSLPRQLIPRLSRETGFERPELEAFWEQWTFMANTEWRDDPDELGVAMDRKTFERCLVPTGGSRHAAPNLIHDRMFSFYDTNNDELIGFTEFLHGLSYRKRKDKLQTVFDGYDIDGDGYVDRRDFLRMFRAYYVLYKQMHKDILDGLEDQLLASTEAQQLVASRQPLSSLFGREGRVPDANHNQRFEGKTFEDNGATNVDSDLGSVVAENHGDTAPREDILTSLFAYGTVKTTHRRLVTGSGGDSNYRILRRVSGNDTERVYWETLLDPPTTLEELPGVFIPNNGETDNDSDDSQRESGSPNQHELTESERRVNSMRKKKKQDSDSERKRRDMARKQLHDRWRRRQFYLDEEEGGLAPDDWQEDEDILFHISQIDQTANKSEDELNLMHQASNSKVRFADSRVPRGSGSSSSSSSKAPRRRREPQDLPVVERDAGKEILYQVTQQAFNELLDAIFKRSEDQAIAAANTKEKRERYAKEIEDQRYADTLANGGVAFRPWGEHDDKPIGKPIGEKSLAELLRDSGYSVVPNEPRNAVDLTDNAVDIHEDQPAPETAEVAAEAEPKQELCYDPTLPQFRPNSEAEAMVNGSGNASSKPAEDTDDEPSVDLLRYWVLVTKSEERAKERGGWGKLSFDEFEHIYKTQEQEGNRLDYLGSWIDFCIP